MKRREVESQEAKRVDLLDYFIFGASYEMVHKVANFCAGLGFCPLALALFAVGTMLAVVVISPSLASFLLPMALIAAFIIFVWIRTGGYARYWSALYKLPTRIKFEKSFVLDLTSFTIKISPRDNAVHEYKMPLHLKDMIRSGIKNPENLYALVSGRENRPLTTLRGLRIGAEDVLLEFGTASFKDMWLTHLLSDVVLARRASRSSSTIKWACDIFYESDDQEKCAKYVTLRNTLGAYLNWYYQSRLAIAGFKKQTLELPAIRDSINVYRCENGLSRSKSCHVTFAQILPNGLGVTGIVLIQEKGGERKILLLQIREKNILDPGKLQWSFSSLVGTYDDFFERKSAQLDYSSDFGIGDLIWEGLYDEVLRPLGLPSTIDYVAEAIALVINAEKLYQPELIVKVQLELEKNKFREVKKMTQPWSFDFCKKSRLLYIPLEKSRIQCFNEWLFSEQNTHRRVRYLFPIVWALIKTDLESHSR